MMRGFKGSVSGVLCGSAILVGVLIKYLEIKDLCRAVTKD